MCKIWGRIQVRISVKMESQIRIRIVIKKIPIHDTDYRHIKVENE